MELLKKYGVWIGVLILFVGGFLFLPTDNPELGGIPPTLEYKGKTLAFNYTDDNTDEDLIIRAVKSTVGGFGGTEYIFSVTNTGQPQSIDVQLYLDNGNVASIQEIIQVEHMRTKTIYGDKPIPCNTPWQATTTVLDGEAYQCEERVISCSSVSGKNCIIKNAPIGTEQVSPFANEKRELALTQGLRKNTKGVIPASHNIKKASIKNVGGGETLYFVADLTYESGLGESTLEQFFIEAVGSKGGYGILDPWFDSDFGFCRPITITAGGGSGGAATTTSLAYTIVATTTLADLKATSSSGKVEKLDNGNDLPLDVIYTDGTDCNDDAGSLVDFYHEKFSSTTGAVVSHIEVTSMSSTSASTFLMYYGNPSATDQSDEAGTFTSSVIGAWNMNQDPSITTDGSCGGASVELCDSTSNNHDGTMGGSMTTSDLVAGQIGDTISFDASNDYFQTPLDEMATISSTTMEYWYNTNNSAGPQLALWAGDVTGNGGGGEDEIHTGFGEPSTGLTQRINVFVETGGDDISANKVTSDTNVWHHVVARYGSLSDTNWVSGWLFFDGALDANDQNTSGAASRAGYDTNLRIGRPGTATRLWNGELDNIRIYNYFMDDMDILTNYNMTVDNATFLTFGAEEETGSAPAGAGGVGEDVTWFIME